MIPVLLLTTLPDPSPTPPAAPPPSWSVGAASTSAFGLTHARFFNQLVSARVDHLLTPRFALGASVSYANLEGKDRRVHNVLPEVSSEYRVGFRGSTVAVPLRLAFGYLPKNGPTLRLSAGLSLRLSRAVTLELVALEPMIWVTRDRTEISLNGAVGLGVAF